MTKNKDARKTLDEHDHISPIRRIELLLWGDKELGIRGLKDRDDRGEKVMFAILAVVVFLLIITVADVQATGGKGLLELLVKGLIG